MYDYISLCVTEERCDLTVICLLQSLLQFQHVIFKQQYTIETNSVHYVQVTVHREKFHKNNQLDASISKIYFCHKTLHVSGIFCAHHQVLSTVDIAIDTLRAGYVTAS